MVAINDRMYIVERNRMRTILLMIFLMMANAEAGPIRDWIATKQGETHHTQSHEYLFDLSYGSDRKQRLDVYLPNKAHHAPIIVMVHGGAWKTGDKKSENVVQNKMRRWIDKGMIFVSINYRLIPNVSIADQVKDVADALSFVQRNADSWGGDPAKIVLMGHSAGAHLVSLLSADPSGYGSLRPWLGTVSLDTATMNVSEVMQRRHLGFYDDAFGSDPALWESYSPYHRIGSHSVPMLAVCSTIREDKPCAGNERYAQKAAQMGVRVDVLQEPLSHGQINEELGKSGEYTDQVEDFFRSLGIGL